MIHVQVSISAYPDGATYEVDVEHTTVSDADEQGDSPRQMRQTFYGIQATTEEDAINQVVEVLKQSLRAQFPGVIFTFEVSAGSGSETRDSHE